MNFKNSELSKWYNTKSGIINSKEIISTVDKIFSVDFEKNILYFGEYSVVKKIMEKNQSFNSYYVSLSEKSDVNAELNKLPFQESSIDCAILIHSLDTQYNPHSAFREIDRILADDGKMIIIGFNRKSLLGIYSLMPFKSIFKNKNYISISRLLDWMSLFSYEVKQVFNINKIPPLKNNKILKYLQFLNNSIFSKINLFGNCYVIYSNKKTYKYISVKNWHKKNNIVLGKFSKPIIHNNFDE